MWRRSKSQRVRYKIRRRPKPAVRQHDADNPHTSCSVILAHPRCGSTALFRAVKRAAGVAGLYEPFHVPMRRKGITFDSQDF